MAYNDLTSKLEAACKALVDAIGLAGVTVNTGVETDTLITPYIICGVRGTGSEEIIGTGLFRLGGAITVASSADDSTLEDHRSRVATVFDTFMDSDIAINLSSAIPDFHCYALFPTSLPSEEMERKMINRLEFEAIVCASDIG